MTGMTGPSESPGTKPSCINHGIVNHEAQIGDISGFLLTLQAEMIVSNMYKYQLLNQQLGKGQ